MEIQIKYPLFFQSLSGSMSFKITSDDRGIKVDKNNISMDPEEAPQIVRLMKLSMALEETSHYTEIMRHLKLVPLEKEKFDEFYYSVQDEIKKRFITI